MTERKPTFAVYSKEGFFDLCACVLFYGAGVVVFGWWGGAKTSVLPPSGCLEPSRGRQSQDHEM